MVVLAGKIQTGITCEGVGLGANVTSQGSVEPLTNSSIPSTVTPSAVDTVIGQRPNFQGDLGMETKRRGHQETFLLASLPLPCLPELSLNVSVLADLKLHESQGHDVVAENWNTTPRSGEGRLREVRTLFMLAWSGHIWRTTVTPGKSDIGKLQPDHDAEEHVF